MQLPTILSGPIIRRTDPSTVNIWIATSVDLKVKAKIYRINHRNGYRYSLLRTKTINETIQLGKRLFIHLIKVSPKHRQFPTDQLLGYNLFFTDVSNTTTTLNSYHLLDQQNPHNLVYGDLKLPSFYINTKGKNNLLYGSCRKAYSQGYDALAGADLQVEENYNQVAERPSTLFLMGDQIYADDIPDPLISFIIDLGKALIGEEENLIELDDRLSTEPFFTSIDKIHGRGFIMKYFAEFTSSNADNHLIRLGEYAAMYLLSFGTQIWELAKEYGVFDAFDNVLENYYFMYPNLPHSETEYQKELEQHQTRYREQVELVYRFQENLYHVQRVLANTPTYMIFDDHDITDDWNITLNWVENVWNAPLGRHVISNGLAAYWAFQGWGNDPDQFSGAFKKQFQRYLSIFNTHSSSYHDWVELLWGFHNWHFTTPTIPRALFIDTRTMRAFDQQPIPTKIGTNIEENISSPQLVSEDGWRLLDLTLRSSNWSEGEPLILVSPTPLYGIGLIESTLNDYVYPLRTLGLPVQTMVDFEAWKYNSEGFTQFLQQIAAWNPSNCYLLSGDVHYAFAAQSNVTFENGQRISIHQFTSSPMNNMSFTGIWGSLMKKMVWLNSYRRKRQQIFRHCDMENNLVSESNRLSCPSDYYWREEIQYLTTGENSVIQTDNNIGLLSVDPDNVQNYLLKYFGLQLEKKTYEPIKR
ncbi:metallophosphoesterase family protein [Aquibacillus kalidii]|uniref:hypothetical protein n=1 Tax=Aquibacillus kalidii TaxID=2762597 RepID=UPI00164505BD|nr:hypothetical protein [Aquibacillus kalidii]